MSGDPYKYIARLEEERAEARRSRVAARLQAKLDEIARITTSP